MLNIYTCMYSTAINYWPNVYNYVEVVLSFIVYNYNKIECPIFVRTSLTKLSARLTNCNAFGSISKLQHIYLFEVYSYWDVSEIFLNPMPGGVEE